MIEIPLISGPEFFQDTKEMKPLIEGILWEEDFIMLLGSEKSGKSLLALQMACALTSGTPFLDKYNVPNKTHVLYIQTEGKRHQVVDRIDKMRQTLDFDETLFTHIPKKFLPLDVPEYFESLITKIDAMPVKPGVVIIDALYMAMSGDLINNKDARAFLSKVAFIMDRYQTTVIVVHHDSRPVFDEHHVEVERADKGSYGSVFFRAIVDHILYLKMNRDKSRTLSCTTQRSGGVMEKEDLILVEPSPLGFEIKGDYKAYEEITRHHLLNSTSPLTYETLIDRTGLSTSSVQKAVRHLLNRKEIAKVSNRPSKFWKIG